jgi:hypothetical protein
MCWGWIEGGIGWNWEGFRGFLSWVKKSIIGFLGAILGWIWEISLEILLQQIWGCFDKFWVRGKNGIIRSITIKLKGKKAIFQGGVTIG